MKFLTNKRSVMTKRGGKSKKKSKSPTKEEKAAEALMKHKLKQLNLEKRQSEHLNADQMQANVLKDMLMNKMKNLVNKETHDLSRHEQLWMEKNPNKMHKKQIMKVGQLIKNTNELLSNDTKKIDISVSKFVLGEKIK